MKPLLITGASGFIGRHAAREFRRLGFDVAGIASADGDISRCPLPAAAHVLHLAGRTFVPDSWHHARDYYSTNVLGTVNVLEHCRQMGVPLVFLSSYLYGEPQTLPIGEEHPLSAPNPYAHTKLLAEEACGFYARTFGVRVTIVRLFNIYGPGQGARFLIPSLLAQAMAPAAPEIAVSDDRPRRDYIYVEDVCDLLVRMVRNPAPGIYNAGSGVSHSVGEVAALVRELTGTSKPFRSRGEYRQNEILETVADVTRARQAFGWQPRTPLRDGLRRTIEVLTHGPAPDDYAGQFRNR